MAEPFKNPFDDGFETRTWDIVNNYDWTSSPAGSELRKQAPNAYVTAYKMDFSQLQQFIDGYINIAESARIAKQKGTNPGLQFYKDMYKSGTIFADINFPYFGDSIRGFSSEYADTFSPISQRAGTFLFGETIEKMGAGAESAIGGAIALGREGGNLGGNAIADKVAGTVGAYGEAAGNAFEKFTGRKLPGLQTVGAPGSYIETPMFYQYSNTDSNVDIEFVLSNTLHDYRDGPTGFQQNKTFIKEFTMMNRPYRYGPIEMSFPAIYHIEIPGLRYIEWAFLENFGIELIGTRRRIGRDIIPEAYGFKFSFKSLTIEAANFVQKVDQVEAFDRGDRSYLDLRKEADKDAIERARKAKEDSSAQRAALLQKWEDEKAEKDREEERRKLVEESRNRIEKEKEVFESGSASDLQKIADLRADDLADQQINLLNEKYYKNESALGRVTEATEVVNEPLQLKPKSYDDDVTFAGGIVKSQGRQTTGGPQEVADPQYVDPDGPKGPLLPGGGVDYERALEIEKGLYRKGEESIFGPADPLRATEYEMLQRPGQNVFGPDAGDMPATFNIDQQIENELYLAEQSHVLTPEEKFGPQKDFRELARAEGTDIQSSMEIEAIARAAETTDRPTTRSMRIAETILYPHATGIEGVTPPGIEMSEAGLQDRQRNFALAWDRTPLEEQDNILQLYEDGTRLTGEELTEAPQEQSQAMADLIARANRIGDRRTNLQDRQRDAENIPAGGGAPPAAWPVDRDPEVEIENPIADHTVEKEPEVPIENPIQNRYPSGQTPYGL